jgi:Rrf2 family protein
MLSLTRKTGYGLIAMVHLAELASEDVASAREVAERFNLPVSLLMNVMKRLASAGHVISVRGARGGYRLARPPEQVRVLDVCTALEGPVRLVDCLHEQDTPGASPACDVRPGCPIAEPIRRLNDSLEAFLGEVTLRDLMTAEFPAAAGSAQAP